MFRSTKEAAKILRTTPGTLGHSVWDGRVDPPVKSPSGQYLWTERDIVKAGWVMYQREIEIPAEEQVRA